ncbi:hypothetical protein JTE90_011096 [Oedothorax gibbosus]|uniref:Sorting nexin-19 n=1 Tax=Oedothorax gibbosus TaxID=931172 RepID=A0AAV6TVL8_9ARAC|nr:hypothetical protein JTE90_011096 [Oedothorax gibbosus]
MQIYLHFFSHYVEDRKKHETFNKENFKIRHWAMKDNTTEWCYLQSLVSTLLDSFCPSDCEKTLHSKYSPLLHTIVVEILTQNIIHPLVKVLSDPVRLNLILLKALENASKTNKGSNESLANLPSQEDSIYSSKANNDIAESPIILLPNEDSSDDSVFISVSKSPPSLSPKYGSTLSEQSYSGGLGDKVFIRDCNDRRGDFLSLVNTGPKSSSNVNLCEQELSEKISTSETTIKRSRSADCVRQVPHKKNYNILQGDTNKMCIAIKRDSSFPIEQAEEANEVPTIFSDVKITDTFLETEDGIPFTRYSIQYKGLFHDTSQSSDVPQFVQQVISIKRRFKEFVALQSSLEDNQSLKTYLKTIKAPSKWQFPISNLDKKHIAERKIFLENYLNQLCSLYPITQSVELQEFLAYGRDQSLFSRRNAETIVPRIDKILVKGVKGAFDIIKTALPNSPLEDESPLPIPKSTGEDISQVINFREHLLDFSSREPEIKEHIINFLENSDFEDFKYFGTVRKRTMLRNVQSLETAESCNCPVLCDRDFLQEKCPFGSTMFELIASCLELHESNIGEPFAVLKILCVPFVDEFFANKLDKIPVEYLCNLLHMLHKYLWPDKNIPLVQSPSLENTDILNRIMNSITEIASSSFPMNTYSGLEETVLNRVQLIVSSLQHQEINKCLLFHIFDAILDATCLN